MPQTARNATQIGAAIRRARRQARLTQAALGAKTGLRQATISELERGEGDVRLSTVLDVLAALGLELVIDERGRASAGRLEDIF